MEKRTLKLFISAYVWMFGGTKKAEREIYKNADDEYIRIVIKAFLDQNRLAFWND